MNLGMALFNLVPALPMDGGRMLRAIWAERRGWLRATRAAGRISRCFALLFIGVALVYGPWTLGLIGVFLFFLVKAEERAIQLRFAPRPSAWSWSLGPRGWVLVPVQSTNPTGR
ncbi:MAG: hypothetical protein HC923_11700 [Myxococcales bacterium]|nr:hypothetical protein [Myxococcales bacterium]